MKFNDFSKKQQEKIREIYDSSVNDFKNKDLVNYNDVKQSLYRLSMAGFFVKLLYEETDVPMKNVTAEHLEKLALSVEDECPF